jgi:hypothetical protein
MAADRMAITPTHRKTHEWPLLLLAIAVVCAVCIPLWLNTGGQQPTSQTWMKLTSERLGRLLLGPEQIASYCCFTWAAFILGGRYRELRRQRRAFAMNLLPTDEGARILPEDARPLMRKVDQTTGRRGPYILANMIRLALGKYAVSRQARDVGETVRTQAEVDLGRLVTSMATVHYLAWAIPALGFLGTVRGLAMTFSLSADEDTGISSFLHQATTHLDVAFDCTLVALGLSLVLMFLLHSVQRDEEALVIDCQQYCLEHLVNRLYDREPTAENEHLAWAGASQRVRPLDS